ncbi:MAG: hypothetical protein KDC54_06165, partial [Lewinella sp.]|nr:hypothetical protein [Lewinella sp.]
KGEQDKAVNLVDTYFEAFPKMNFTFGIHAAYMLGIYVQADAYDKAKEYMPTVAENTLERLNYFMSLPDDILQSSYGNDFQAALAVADRLVSYAQQAGDTEYLQTLMEYFGEYVSPQEPAPMPGVLDGPAEVPSTEEAAPLQIPPPTETDEN